MITITPTPNFAGVTICGDFHDFEELYDAIHELTGEEDQFPSHSHSIERSLALCYDLRHAMMGHREFELKENGPAASREPEEENINPMIPVKNLYFKFNVIMTELIFNLAVFEDLIKMRHSRKGSYFKAEAEANADPVVCLVRMFRAKALNAILPNLAKASANRIFRELDTFTPRLKNFFTPFVDKITLDYLKLKPEQRPKRLAGLIEKMLSMSSDYLYFKSDMEAAAYHQGVSVEMLEYGEYPEEIDW